MADEPSIDPALGLTLVGHRSLTERAGPVSICIPAHNEAASIVEVVCEAYRAIEILGVEGEVIVAASACSDDTARLAQTAGAHVTETTAGKGNAITAALSKATGAIIATVDGDFRYFGPEPIAATLLRPILAGIVDATIADLYWRPLYPQMWLYGFFGPLAGRLFPEMLPKFGTTPWSGQRAAVRELWPCDLPADFTVDMTLNLAWNDNADRVRSIPADDWTNPQRPKPDLLRREFDLLIEHGIAKGRLRPDDLPALDDWYRTTQRRMATYRPDKDDAQEFEKILLREAINTMPQPPR
ncbi:glycosyltransferase [Frankia sp. AgKG'84/4]|uniref:glycosyltransferase n=1 Tax=Frankia sp. AgKG'84/4 TaxID=573490 RepID=UPI00200CF8E8|nr:glycosyltransferase [Frankia sp. AgKG'84/4]MCL9795533.1 glycosyltransferase [Frankia sp. AgKG'84/4]